MSVAELIVVTGPPGAGKSTVAALLAQRFDPSALVAGDDVFAFLARGAVAPWLPEAHRQNEVVLQAAAAAAGRFAAGERTAVYDGVVGPWFLPVFAAATGLGHLHYALLLPPLERCLARVAARTGHGFTDPVAARHMHGEFARAEVEPRHVVEDAADDPGTVAASVLERFEAGRLRHEVQLLLPPVPPEPREPGLVPELICSDLEASLTFYGLLGLTPAYQRPRERFAHLVLGDAHLMLEQPLTRERLHPRAELVQPYGRGINLSLEVEDVRAVHDRVVAAGHPVVLALEERWYERATDAVGVRQFAVADPDGYVVRPTQEVGTRPLR